MRFRLLVGQHIGPDLSKEPVTREYINSKTGEKYTETRYPSRTYNAGEIVEDDTDLVVRFGAQKFQLIGEDEDRIVRRKPTPTKPSPPVKVAPVEAPVEVVEEDEDEVEDTQEEPPKVIPPRPPVKPVPPPPRRPMKR